ncbi:NAD(P)H-quinone oxidoreductase, partial [Escherichia coli]|nr:NAD(P)H-quinone oxidoreductase [Escherichia coli]
MKALVITNFGGPEVLAVKEVPDPQDTGGILVRVRAAGINRADILQRRGFYPPPEGINPYIPGLE